MKWDKVKIGNLCYKAETCNPAERFKNDDFYYLDISSIDSTTKLIGTVNKITGTNAPSRARQIVKNCDILVSTVRPNLNAVARVTENYDKAIASTGFCVLRVEKDKLYDNYLFYWVRSSHFIKNMVAQAAGASYPAVSDTIIKNSLIPLPPLHIQKKIADTLDKADALRQKDQQLEQKYDDLAQAIFYDMFGDPAHNNKQWEVKQLKDIVSLDKYSLKRGPFGGALKKEIFKSSGYLVYEQYHAINDAYDVARYFIDDAQFKILEAFEVKSGDLIVSCSGVTLGRISELPKDALPGIINQALLKIKLDQAKIRNDFFVFQFRGQLIQSKLFGFSRGSGIPNFPPMEEVRSLEFVVPPVEMQQKFSQVFRNIQVQKKKILDAESDQLFNVLLDRAYN